MLTRKFTVAASDSMCAKAHEVLVKQSISRLKTAERGTQKGGTLCFYVQNVKTE